MPAVNLLRPAASAYGRVAVLLGGRSAERDISLLTGHAVLQALRSAGMDVQAFDPALQSLGELAVAGFDRAFLALHGRYGEDGAMQGVLELLGIPYTGSGVQASAIAMDKVTTKRLWQAEGLPTPAWTTWVAARTGPAAPQPGAGLAADWARLGARLILKPVNEGSTFGVSKVDAADSAALLAAAQMAGDYGGGVLIEECVEGRELTCAVLGSGAAARALPLVEIRAPGANYDYRNKYFTDATEYLCPAPLAPTLAARIADLCLRAYHSVGARGWGRLDLMLRSAGGGDEPLLLEINTTPGLTDHSLVPMAARAAGIDFIDLVLQILAAAQLDAASAAPSAPAAGAVTRSGTNAKVVP